MPKNLLPAILLLLIAFLTVLITSPTAFAAPDELIQNGGFEAGTDPWQAYNGDLSLATSPVHSGTHSAKLTTDKDMGNIWQLVDVQPSCDYNFSGYAVKNDLNIECIFLRIQWLNESFIEILKTDTNLADWLVSDDPNYRFISVAGTAPSTACSARIRCMIDLEIGASTPATAYFDDMSFEGPPPPAPSPSPTVTTSPTLSMSPTSPPTATPSPTGSATISPTPSPTATGIPTATPTPTSSATPTTTASRGEILINEVQYNPPQPGADASFEWLELYNPTDDTVELRGWSISDNYGTDAIPPLNISADSLAIIAASQDFYTNFPDRGCTVVIVQDGSIGNGLSNDGDRLALKDGDGTTIDSMSYGDDGTVSSPPHPKVAEGHSLERSPAGGVFIDNPDPSPCSTLATVNATPDASCTATPTGDSTTPSTSDTDEGETTLLSDEPDEPVDPVWPALAAAEALALCGIVYMIDRKRKQKSK